MMNFWHPTWTPWGDDFDPSLLPLEDRYDWVKLYTFNSSTNEFDLDYFDDFDSLDLEEWIVSDNWTYDGNNCTFYSSQVRVEDSNLIFTMDFNSAQQLI